MHNVHMLLAALLLMPLAKVPYRCGQEAREEYNEPHAGQVFCNIAHGAAPRDAAEGKLNIRPYGSSTTSALLAKTRNAPPPSTSAQKAPSPTTTRASASRSPKP